MRPQVFVIYFGGAVMGNLFSCSAALSPGISTGPGGSIMALLTAGLVWQVVSSIIAGLNAETRPVQACAQVAGTENDKTLLRTATYSLTSVLGLALLAWPLGPPFWTDLQCAL